MANDDHIAQLTKGVAAWNAWRKENPVRPDLNEANLFKANLVGADLSGADLSEANLSEANLSEANLFQANLSGANLSKAKLTRISGLQVNFSGAKLPGAMLDEAFLIQANLADADLSRTNLFRANLGDANLQDANLAWSSLMSARLSGADLRRTTLRPAVLCFTDLTGANLSGVDLREDDLERALLVETDLRYACLDGCRVYGTSVWNVKTNQDTKQQNLIITRLNEPDITVDNIEVAQFIYLMLNNQKVRDVIDTITSKAVLILGRFTDERKAVLDALREQLRQRDYLPILFDFEKPRSLDTDETITLLARMARFVIADISDAKSVLQELRAIVPDLPSVPVQSIILATQEEPGMFDFYRNRPSFLAVHRYADQKELLADLRDKVIRPAEKKAGELRG
jgi:uncharacterized protein YjbI with pentapeptide repeats